MKLYASNKMKCSMLIRNLEGRFIAFRAWLLLSLPQILPRLCVIPIAINRNRNRIHQSGLNGSSKNVNLSNCILFLSGNKKRHSWIHQIYVVRRYFSSNKAGKRRQQPNMEKLRLWLFVGIIFAKFPCSRDRIWLFAKWVFERSEKYNCKLTGLQMLLKQTSVKWIGIG